MSWKCVVCALVSWVGVAAAGADDILPLAQVKKGMIGVGRTVFKGTEIEEFKVEILGILPNSGARQNMILARLSGGPLEKTGVIMGMSGSPVYVDGKVIGAVSSAFPYSTEAIAGITPIEEMISSTTAPAAPASSTQADARATFRRILTLEDLTAPLRANAPSSSGAPSSHIQTPLAVSGLSGPAAGLISSIFTGFQMVPVAGGSTGGQFQKAIDQPIESIQPGAALSVALVRGDMDISAVGTVTYVDKDRVYAFGHPFFNMGPIQFPMARAEVITLLPNLYASFKIATTTDVIGTADQDRSTALSGRLGERPRMIPVNLTLETSLKAKEHYRFEIVSDRSLSPVLAYVTAFSAITSRERAYGQNTLRLTAAINFDAGPPLAFGDLFTGDGTAGNLAMQIATPVYYLMNNPYRDAKIAGIDMTVRSEEAQKIGRLDRIEFDCTSYRPGQEMKMKVHLRGLQNEPIVEEAAFEMPRNLKSGDVLLYVGDGSTLDALDAADLHGADYYPQSYSQLLRALENLRRSNRIYFRILERRPGMVVQGEELSDLPPSAAAIMASRQNTQETRRTALAPVFDAELGTDYAVAGYRLLAVRVRD